VPEAVRAIAWKAQLRLCQRYRHMIAKGKLKQVVVTAIARERAGVDLRELAERLQVEGADAL
jgi:hypothetical protein